MIYYVDGFNFLNSISCFRDLMKKSRVAATDAMQQLVILSSSINSGTTVIVFDGKEVSLTPQRNVRVVFVNNPQQIYDRADNYIAQQISEKQVATVVTNDKDLANRVRAKGVQVMSVETYYRMISSKPPQKPTKPPKVEQVKPTIPQENWTELMRTHRPNEDED